MNYRVVMCEHCRRVQVTGKKYGLNCKYEDCARSTSRPEQYYTADSPYVAANICQAIKYGFAKHRPIWEIKQELGI